jgi:hypothetical protein
MLTYILEEDENKNKIRIVEQFAQPNKINTPARSRKQFSTIERHAGNAQCAIKPKSVEIFSK